MKRASERLSKQYGRRVVRAYHPNLRGSASKARLVVDTIRNLDIALAIPRLTLSPKRVAKHVLKLLNQAIANATNNHGLAASSLYIFKAVVNESRTLKRVIPVLRGNAHRIRKRSCHLEILLAERESEGDGVRERLLNEFDSYAAKQLTAKESEQVGEERGLEGGELGVAISEPNQAPTLSEGEETSG